MDKTRLIAELKKQYGMSDDLAGRVAENVIQSGYTKPYQKAVDAVNPPAQPQPQQSAFATIRQLARDIPTMQTTMDPQAAAASTARIQAATRDPELEAVQARGTAPLSFPTGNWTVLPPLQPQQEQPAQQVQRLTYSAQQLAMQLQAQHGLDPASSMVLAAKLYPIPPHHMSDLGPRGRN